MVEALRRWWTRAGVATVFTGLALGSAIALRQSNSGLLADAYALITGIFRPRLDTEIVLTAAMHAELRSQVAELQRENQGLRQLLGFQQDFRSEALPAQVVGRAADNWWHQITLGQGRRQGVNVGDIVMAPGGLVGRVDAVTAHTSRTLLISDPTSRVGVLLSRTRAMGILRGQGTTQAVMEFFDRTPTVQIGDAVVTSGLGSLYPAGLVVGQVRSVDLDASPAPEAVVELGVPLGLLEWALIYQLMAEAEALADMEPEL